MFKYFELAARPLVKSKLSLFGARSDVAQGLDIDHDGCCIHPRSDNRINQNHDAGRDFTYDSSITSVHALN